MALDRGRLTKIDRRVFAELNHTAGTQAVKVPVSDALWSTWRRYCEALRLSMGNGVAGLILDELESVVRVDDPRNHVFAEQASRQAEERTAELDARQRAVDHRAEALERKEEHLREWERRLNTPRVARGQTMNTGKVGRNDRCPCGSGLKYKHCHGLPGRPV
jgi:preprotein translocase subunit SecA